MHESRVHQVLASISLILIIGCHRPVISNPGVELDHVYIWVTPHAPEADTLRKLGFSVVDDTAHHRGNGTSSLGVMFENAYLELLYPDSAVSDSSLTPDDHRSRARRLAWRTNDASPFGIGLRRAANAPDSLTFASRAITAPWIKPGQEIRMVTSGTDSISPSVFVVPRYMALTGWINESLRDTSEAWWFKHRTGVHRVTHVRVVLINRDGITPVLRQLGNAHVFELATGPQQVVELTLDDGKQGVIRDLRPTLPLVIRY